MSSSTVLEDCLQTTFSLPVIKVLKQHERLSSSAVRKVFSSFNPINSQLKFQPASNPYQVKMDTKFLRFLRFYKQLSVGKKLKYFYSLDSAVY